MKTAMANVSRTRLGRLLPALLTLSLVAGCATAPTKYTDQPDTPEIAELLFNKPEVLKPLYRKLAHEGERNVVLNYEQLGVVALETGQRELAKEAFDKATLRIDQIYAGTESAAKARSLWNEEGGKEFKGEPYERAMAFYYRGLIYLMDGELDNARASFKNAILQDAFAEEEQYQCDFAMMYFLSGWASQQMGDKEFAEEAYAMARKLRPDFVSPLPDHNVLIIAESGNSPRKLSDGLGHYQMKIFRGKRITEASARFQIKGYPTTIVPFTDDVFYQASTRGSRAMDSILQGKAVFRESAAEIGTTMADVAAKAMIAAPIVDAFGGPHLQNISAGIGLVGAVTTMAAISSRPEADTRYWKNLPDRVHLATTRLAPGSEATVHGDFLDEKNQPKPELARDVPVQFASGTGLAWMRSQPALQTIDAWHNVTE